MNIAQLADERRIFTCRAGSHAYGLNTAQSDEDTRGVFVGLPDNLIGLYPVEHCEYHGDYMVYELRKFVNLAKDCNPNIIELLYVDSGDILFSTSAWEKLRSGRDLFLTRRAKQTFSGYATAQLKKIRGHNKWLHNPQPVERPEPAKYLKTKFIEGLGEREVFDQRAYDDAHRTWKQYWEWKENRNPARAQLEAEFGFDCYSADTEFLTAHGWQHFDDIADDVPLATLFWNRDGDAMTHRRFLGVEYQRPTQSFEGSFTGNLFHFFGHHTDVLVTPNHRMLARPVSRKTGDVGEWQLEEAALLPDSFDVLVGVAPRTHAFSYDALFEDLPLPAPAYLALMGWYLSDGYISWRGDRPYSCRISQKKGGKLSWHMARFLADHCGEEGPVNASLYDYERAPNSKRAMPMIERVLDVRHPELVRRLYADCGRGEKKRIPRWVFGLSRRLMERLFDALVRGDGTIRRSTPDQSVIYYSSSSDLADDVQELAFHCGWESARWGPYQGTRAGECAMYQVHVNKKAPRTRRLIRNQNLRLIPVENHRIVCFTVPNGVLITRRNGKIGVHGNSKHAMHLIRLLKMGHEILSGQGVNVKRADRAELLAIRQGQWDFERVTGYADELMAQMDELYPTAPLPRAPDLKRINDLMIEIYRDYWGERGEI